jgi:hypothetical protein
MHDHPTTNPGESACKTSSPSLFPSSLLRTHTRALFTRPVRHVAHLSVAAEGEGVVALPGGAARGAQLVGQVAPLAQATVLASSGGETPQLPVLVHGLHDPVDPRVLAPQMTLPQRPKPFATNGRQAGMMRTHAAPSKHPLHPCN